MKTCPHCGSASDANEKPRSLPQLRRYFAMIRSAFHHWPETAQIQFASEEECRKHLQMQAGWREIGARIPLFGANPDVIKMIVRQSILVPAPTPGPSFTKTSS